ncbi:MAG: hypothetical protein KatS3mg073_0663 [Meiothermus sp.]|nr:MAG: hypothetical protein KatS3mg073_0663 [Meiothermus sp.]
MSQDRPPRRLRLARLPSESKPGRPVPQAVSTQLIERLLSAGANQAFEWGLEELLRELPGVEQAFLWVRDGQNRFSLQAFRGVAQAALEGIEAVVESSLKTAYLGSPEGWLGGKAHLDREEHFLYRVFSALPFRLQAPAHEPAVNLTLPLVASRQVWAVLHLYAPARSLGQAEVDWVSQYMAGVAPILREVYLREAAERQSLWLSAINALFRVSHEQPLELGLQDALEEATRLSGAEGARLITFEGHAIRTIAQAGWGSGLPVEAAITRQLGERLRGGQQVGIPRYDLYPAHRPELVEAGLRSLFILPILRHSREAGALLLFSTQQHWLPDAQTQELLSDMAAAIGVVRVEWTLRRELAWAAYTDPLTGLGNRRAFERDLEKLTHRANGRVVVLVLLDLDGFKAINDTYGHIHADHVLVRLGGVLRSRARAGDRAYRLGGDEFALIIEGSSTLNPLRTAERYRALLEEIRVSDSTFLKVSLGYAVYPTDVSDIQNLWRIADDQMYKDKALRKGRTPLFTQGQEQFIQINTPLFRLANRLAQALKMGPEEQQVLQASCYLLQMALGEIESSPDVQMPDGLLREAARVLMFVQSHWDGRDQSLGWSGESIPRAARVLQVARQFTAAVQPVEGRAARSVEEALEDIAKEARQRFDPVVVEALLSIRSFLSEDSAA